MRSSPIASLDATVCIFRGLIWIILFPIILGISVLIANLNIAHVAEHRRYVVYILVAISAIFGIRPILVSAIIISSILFKGGKAIYICDAFVICISSIYFRCNLRDAEIILLKGTSTNGIELRCTRSGRAVSLKEDIFRESFGAIRQNLSAAKIEYGI